MDTTYRIVGVFAGKWVPNPTGATPYGYYEESVIGFTYEEMVELLNAGRKATQGNECLESMKRKAQNAYEKLPVTDY